MDFEQPLHKMALEELCIITLDGGDLRCQDALKELERRGIDTPKRMAILDEVLKKEQKAYDEHLGVLKENKTIGYTPVYKAVILVFGPLLILSHYGHLARFVVKQLDANYLRENGFEKKLQERRNLLIASFVLLAIYAYLSITFNI